MTEAHAADTEKQLATHPTRSCHAGHPATAHTERQVTRPPGAVAISAADIGRAPCTGSPVTERSLRLGRSVEVRHP